MAAGLASSTCAGRGKKRFQSNRLWSKLLILGTEFDDESAPTQSERAAWQQLSAQTDAQLQALDHVISRDIAELNALIKQSNLPRSPPHPPSAADKPAAQPNPSKTPALPMGAGVYYYRKYQIFEYPGAFCAL